MEPQFWHTRWTENQIGFHQEKVNSRLIKLWPAIGLEPGEKVFVPLCGKTRDMLWLASQSYRVLGVELSKIACQDFFKENRIEYQVSHESPFEIFRSGGIELWAGDFFDLSAEALAEISGVYDRASLVALPESLRQAYVHHLSAILSSGIKVMLISMEYDQTKMQGPPFSVTEEEIHGLFEADFNVRKVSESSGPDIVGNLKQRGLDTLTEKIFVLTHK
ncbi:MAG: thiopurine S-methyltransferase [bacterium]